MISLSDNLSNVISKQLNKETLTRDFTEEDLGKITFLCLSKNDLDLIRYFKNVKELEISQFPSIDEKDILHIANYLPELKVLRIKEQSALVRLDLTNFKNLEELELAYNDNLVSFSGVGHLANFIFYDNKDFANTQQIVDLMVRNKKIDITLDIVYYADVVRCLKELDEDVSVVDNYTWIEAIGLRKHLHHIYTKEEVQALRKELTDIVAKYLYVTDGEIEKFGVLYYWMVQNIEFVNEDDPSTPNVDLVSNIYKVFSNRKGGRLSFAKAFQLLLTYGGVKSSVVYSLGALDTIGYYNGKQVYSLLGTSDYALLRINIDHRYYYSDIAWDSMVSKYKYFDELRLFLVSKEELKIRHKFVGEGNIISSYSYHGDDSDDLIMFASDRIKNVDEVLDDVERYKEDILGVELNINILNKKVVELRNQIDSLDNNDKDQYNELHDELKEKEELLEREESSLVKLNNQRDGVIDSYAPFFKEHYLCNSGEMSLTDILEELDNRQQLLLSSFYMVEIIQQSLKAI